MRIRVSKVRLVTLVSFNSNDNGHISLGCILRRGAEPQIGRALLLNIVLWFLKVSFPTFCFFLKEVVELGRGSVCKTLARQARGLELGSIAAVWLLGRLGGLSLLSELWRWRLNRLNEQTLGLGERPCLSIRQRAIQERHWMSSSLQMVLLAWFYSGETEA